MDVQCRPFRNGGAVGGNRLDRSTGPTERKASSGVYHEVPQWPSGSGHPSGGHRWHADVVVRYLEAVLVPEECPVRFLNLWNGVPTLQESRAELDALDVSLVQVLARRSRVILDVIRYKRANAMGVVDRGREDRMLENIERVALSEGLDPRIARQVLRSVIDAFTLLEVEELGPDPT